VKPLPGILFIPLLAACTVTPRTLHGEFVAAPGEMDARIETASIEDYIVALPPFTFHEESVEGFARRVRQARTMERGNAGRSQEVLFVSGDGTWPAREFHLDRSRRMLTIRSFKGEPGTGDEMVTMRRVPGGWMRGRGGPAGLSASCTGEGSN